MAGIGLKTQNIELLKKQNAFPLMLNWIKYLQQIENVKAIPIIKVPLCCDWTKFSV